MLKRILLTLALAGSVMTGIAACNNSNSGGGTTSSTAPLSSTEASTGAGASMSTESSAPLASPSSS